MDKKLPGYCTSKNGCNLWRNKTTICCMNCGMNENYSPIIAEKKLDKKT